MTVIAPVQTGSRISVLADRFFEVNLCVEHLDERRLRSLDAGRRHSLPAEVRTDEQMRRRKESACPGEATERRFGIGETQQARL
jgi:hypothetical protein